MFLFINDFDPLKSYGREYGMFCVRAWAVLTAALIGIAATGSPAAAAFSTSLMLACQEYCWPPLLLSSSAHKMTVKK